MRVTVKAFVIYSDVFFFLCSVKNFSLLATRARGVSQKFVFLFLRLGESVLIKERLGTNVAFYPS